MILSLILAASVLLDRAVAQYDRDVITLGDVRDHVLMMQLEPDEGESEEDFQRRMAREIILKRLRLNEIRSLGFSGAGDEEVDARVQLLAGTPALENLTIKQLRSHVQGELTLKHYIQERFLPQVFVSEKELTALYRDRFETEPDPPPFEQVREEMERLLKLQKLNDLLKDWNSDLLSGITIRYLTPE